MTKHQSRPNQISILYHRTFTATSHQGQIEVCHFLKASKKVSENFSSLLMMLASTFNHILFSQSCDFSLWALVYLNAVSSKQPQTAALARLSNPPPPNPLPVRGAAVFSHLAVVPWQQRLVSVPSNRPICLARADNEPVEVTAEVSPTPSPTPSLTPLPPRCSVSAASAEGTLVSAQKDKKTPRNWSNKMSTCKAGPTENYWNIIIILYLCADYD